MANEIFEKIQNQLAEYFEIDAATITTETRFSEDLKADSLAIMELMFNLESEYGITLDDDVVENVKTVGDLVNCIENK